MAKNGRVASTVLIVCLLLILPAGVAQADGFVVDHRQVALFEDIPVQYIEAARNLRLLFSDRSVGGNIDQGLNCLMAASWPEAPAYCRRDYYDSDWNWRTYVEADWLSGDVPPRILYDPDPVLYNRSNWMFEYRAGSWEELTCDFVQSLAPAYLPTTDVLSYQFSYLNVVEGDNIADPNTGFFADRPDHCDVGDLEELMDAHPERVFFFWTSSLARGIGSQTSTDFNEQMRAYCLANDVILLDAADILAHTDGGTPCVDNRDGIPYEAMNGSGENYPDDGFDYPAICQDWTTEVDGGHLGSVSGGMIAMVKAMWVLMAQVAGWVPPEAGLPTETQRDHLRLELCGPWRIGDEIVVRYELPRPGRIRLDLYDAQGRHVLVIGDEPHRSGAGESRFSTSSLRCGVYVLSLRLGSDRVGRKLVLVE